MSDLMFAKNYFSLLGGAFNLLVFIHLSMYTLLFVVELIWINQNKFCLFCLFIFLVRYWQTIYEEVGLNIKMHFNAQLLMLLHNTGNPAVSMHAVNINKFGKSKHFIICFATTFEGQASTPTPSCWWYTFLL